MTVTRDPTPPSAAGWAGMSAADAVRRLGSSSDTGLSEPAALAAASTAGPNSIRRAQVSAARVLVRQFKNAVLILLLATTAAAAALGDL
ncbi:MAG: Cation transporter/ATPase, N-terminus, partial [Microbacteriaceae bacterium]|nr:Cation transporter/ATPase, N-terminus [Microbacteriaceae bacterium]